MIYEVLIILLVGLFYLLLFNKGLRQKFISRPIDYVDILTELAELKTNYSSLEKKVLEQEEELSKIRESIVFYEEKSSGQSNKNISSQINFDKIESQSEKTKKRNLKEKNQNS